MVVSNFILVVKKPAMFQMLAKGRFLFFGALSKPRPGRHEVGVALRLHRPQRRQHRRLGAVVAQPLQARGQVLVLRNAPGTRGPRNRRCAFWGGGGGPWTNTCGPKQEKLRAKTETWTNIWTKHRKVSTTESKDAGVLLDQIPTHLFDQLSLKH